MTTKHPRLEMTSVELADWLDQQDPESWWSVDGDPLLTGIVGFPCPADVLSAELRRINQTLLVIPPGEVDPGDRHVTPAELEEIAYLDPFRNERIIGFRWEKPPSLREWLLVEDKVSAKYARGLDDDELDEG